MQKDMNLSKKKGEILNNRVLKIACGTNKLSKIAKSANKFACRENKIVL